MPPPNVIAVELFDNSVFKFPLSANTTPRVRLRAGAMATPIRSEVTTHAPHTLTHTLALAHSQMLLVNVAKKAGLNDYGLFGLVCGTSSDVEGILEKERDGRQEFGTRSSAPHNIIYLSSTINTEAFYLADDESISAQLPLSMSAPRVTLSLKYCFRDITSDLADPVALKLAFLEVCHSVEVTYHGS